MGILPWCHERTSAELLCLAPATLVSHVFCRYPAQIPEQFSKSDQTNLKQRATSWLDLCALARFCCAEYSPGLDLPFRLAVAVCAMRRLRNSLRLDSGLFFSTTAVPAWRSCRPVGACSQREQVEVGEDGDEEIVRLATQHRNNPRALQSMLPRNSQDIYLAPHVSFLVAESDTSCKSRQFEFDTNTNIPSSRLRISIRALRICNGCHCHNTTLPAGPCTR